MIFSGQSLCVYEAKSENEFLFGQTQAIVEMLGVQNLYRYLISMEFYILCAFFIPVLKFTIIHMKRRIFLSRKNCKELSWAIRRV